MSYIKRLGKMLGLLAVVALVTGLMNFAFISSAQAADTVDDSQVVMTQATTASDETTNNEVEDPEVVLTGNDYSTAAFAVDGTLAAKASLKTATGVKVVLNVSVGPIPQTKISKCWRVKVGTWIWNEVVDPATSKRSVIRWQVPAGDNIFCYKKGFGKQVFKKSCNNRVWGVPGGPKYPPKSLPRIRVKVSVQDYLTYSGKQTVKTSQSGSATAYAVQYYNGVKVCEAKATVTGYISVYISTTITVKARTFTSIKTSAVNAAKVKVYNQITASGEIITKIDLQMTGKAEAWCDYTPPPPPPPVYEAPSVDVTPVACVKPGESKDVTITVTNPNDVSDTAKVTYRGQVYTKAVAANSQVTFTFANQAAGTYNGVALLVTANKSKGFVVTVQACPPPEDNPPSMTCQGPQHIFVGDDAMFADFDLTDPDGNPVSFSEPVVTGPLQIVLVEDSTIAGGKHRTVGIRAGDVPSGQSQNATLKVTGSAGGKSVSCTVNVIVENNHTGW